MQCQKIIEEYLQTSEEKFFGTQIPNGDKLSIKCEARENIISDVCVFNTFIPPMLLLRMLIKYSSKMRYKSRCGPGI